MRKGQTIIEVLVALGAAILIMTAIVFAVTSSLSSAQFSKNLNVANHYAKQGLEIVRQIRDSGLLDGALYPDGKYCLDKDSNNLTPRGSLIRNGCNGVSGANVIDRDESGDIVAQFAREVDINREVNIESPDNIVGSCIPTPPPAPTPTPDLSGTAKVTVIVSWSDNDCTTEPFCHKTKISSCFFKINTVTAP